LTAWRKETQQFTKQDVLLHAKQESQK